MDIVDGILQVGPFRGITWAIVVLFIGRWLISKSRFLRDYNIPEAVVGGLLFAIFSSLVYFAFGVAIEFDLGARDFLLVYFFTTIGLNAKLSDLVTGGKPLLILLAATVGYMLIQDLTGIAVASALGLPAQVGLLGGTVSLIGGHGTTIAWSPVIAEHYDIPNAMEIGVACATFGLVLASSMGGPIAKYLITKYSLKPTSEDTNYDVGISEEGNGPSIEYSSFLKAIFVIHVSISLGVGINEGLEGMGLKMPLFVSCLFGGVLLRNLGPKLFRRIQWPARTPSLALIAEVSLGIFLAMSLMSMQLWELLDLAGPIFIILIAQFVIAAGITVFVIFRIMGRDYNAAVVCSGFGGISLGSTATAMANMTAVTQRYGPSHLAFIIVPLVCAFFIDIVNAFMIQYFLNVL